MKAAEALQGTDAPRTDDLRESAERVLGGQRDPRGTREPEPRAAARAGDGLGMEAAVRGVFVFPLTRGAHPEGRHRRAFAVVGHLTDDRGPWTAPRAVDERMQVAPI